MVEAVARGLQRVAATERRLHQILRPQTVLLRLPEILAPIGLHPLDACFSSPPAFHHTLRRSETVETGAGDAAVAYANGVADARPQRHLDRRRSPRDGQA